MKRFIASVNVSDNRYACDCREVILYANTTEKIYTKVRKIKGACTESISILDRETGNVEAVSLKEKLQ